MGTTPFPFLFVCIFRHQIDYFLPIFFKKSRFFQIFPFSPYRPQKAGIRVSFGEYFYVSDFSSGKKV